MTTQAELGLEADRYMPDYGHGPGKGDPEAGIPPVVKHGMLAGSHERPSGPKCRCGAEWDWFNDHCTSVERTNQQEGTERAYLS